MHQMREEGGKKKSRESWSDKGDKRRKKNEEGGKIKRSIVGE